MNQAIANNDLFEKMPIPRAVAKLAVPTVLSQLVMLIYSLAGTFWVGMLNDPIENAAVTIASPALLALSTVTNLFGVGASSLMSRALGSRDYDRVSRTSAFGFYCTLVCALLLTVVCAVCRNPLLNLLGADESTYASSRAYFTWAVTCGAVPAVLNTTMAYLVRAEGMSLHASLGTMSGCAFNIVLDPIFILPWGLNMGAGGAGLATFLSNCLACVYFAILLICKRGRTYVSVDPRKFSFDRKIARDVFAIGVPSALQNLLSVAGQTILNNFTSAVGPNATAAMGICNKIYMVPMYATFGIAQGAMPLMGYNYASGNVQRVKKTIRFTRAANLIVIGAFALVFLIFPHFFMSLFIRDQTIIDIGAPLLQGFSLALPMLSIDFFSVAVFQSVGMGKEAFAFAVTRKLVLEIPLMFLFNEIRPLYGLPYAQLVAELVLAIASFFVMARFYRRMAREHPQVQTN